MNKLKIEQHPLQHKLVQSPPTMKIWSNFDHNFLTYLEHEIHNAVMKSLPSLLLTIMMNSKERCIHKNYKNISNEITTFSIVDYHDEF